MNVGLLVCTYGSHYWKMQGDHAMDNILDAVPFERWLRSHMDGGTLARVRNQAATVLDTDWLCFVDGDDTLAPGYLDAMAEACESYTEKNPDASLLLVPSISIPSSQRTPTIPDWKASIYDLNCAVIGTLVRRDLFLAAGGFHEEPMYEDWSLWLRCIRLGARMLPVRNAVYLADERTDSRNRQSRRLRLETWNDIRHQHKNVPPETWAYAKVEE